MNQLNNNFNPKGKKSIFKKNTFLLFLLYSYFFLFFFHKNSSNDYLESAALNTSETLLSFN